MAYPPAFSSWNTGALRASATKVLLACLSLILNESAVALANKTKYYLLTGGCEH